MLIETIDLRCYLVKAPIDLISEKFPSSKQTCYLVRNNIKTPIDVLETAVDFFKTSIDVIKTAIDLVSEGLKLSSKLLLNN